MALSNQQVPSLDDGNGFTTGTGAAGAMAAVPGNRLSRSRQSQSQSRLALANSTRLQVIDDEQRFSWRLGDAGFDYNVVAVFGSQSTGKSTLLNRLFGTKFDVMDDAQRQQTTRGIWADRGTDGMRVVIMDVEGTDGRERGENQDFERKSALFSLAVSEVLIVNMWEHTVGLYNGANMGLLKTVMEVNLQLFGGQSAAGGSKTLLYFVVRDHVSQTPLENLARTLEQDMQRIWDSLSRPAELQDARLADFFDLRFASLPHKTLQPENFEKRALQLRTQFTDRQSSGYVFRAEYKRRVPADGFAHYAAAVWEKVVSNKDLDLPTQQELLAQYRCDEIAAAAVVPFRACVEELRPRVEGGAIVEELGSRVLGERAAALAAFDEQAVRYHGDVYAKRRAALVQTLDGELYSLFLNQVKNASSRAASSFASDGQRALESGKGEENGDDGESEGFAAVVGGIRRRVTKWFAAVCAQLTAEDGAWSFGSEARNLEMQLDAAAERLRVAEMERAVKQLRRRARRSMADVVAERLNSPTQGDMWAAVMRDGFAVAVTRAEDALERRMDGAGIADVEGQQQQPPQRTVLVRRLRRGVWEELAELLREEVGDQMVLLKLRNALEDGFRYDDNGLPRVWKPSDDIDAQFAAARGTAQALLPKLSRIDAASLKPAGGSSSSAAAMALVRRGWATPPPAGFFPPGFDFEATLTLVSPVRQRELAKRFAREADALYLEAKRAMVTTQSHVPAWVLVLLVVLGWNEAMAILFNPLYLVLAALVGGSAFVIHSLGLWGPVVRSANGVAALAGDHVHALLVEAVNRTEPAAQAAPRRRRSPRQLSASGGSSSAADATAAGGIELEPLGADALSPSLSSASESASPSAFAESG
ncbi:Dynamin-like GTPase that mediates homotypic ER fusion [Coemansia sp. RSA 2049]|nr:Dynamin-like GTPase that mediates homotypic ER fusion [Coemansia sp. RSA 2049]